MAWTVLTVCSNRWTTSVNSWSTRSTWTAASAAARGVVADGIEVPEERLDVALELLGDLRHPPRAAGDDDDRDLRDRHGERRHRDDAQKTSLHGVTWCRRALLIGLASALDGGGERRAPA